MHGGYNYTYDKVVMPRLVAKRCPVEFYFTKVGSGASCNSMHEMLGRRDDEDRKHEGHCEGRR